MRCKICNKPLKENTDGNNRYCQGHDIISFNHCFACDQGYSTYSNLNKHFQTKKHNLTN